MRAIQSVIQSESDLVHGEEGEDYSRFLHRDADADAAAIEDAPFIVSAGRSSRGEPCCDPKSEEEESPVHPISKMEGEEDSPRALPQCRRRR
jgi:hypothetical protein